MNFQENVSLKNYSNYRIGGPAKFFAQVEFTEELKEALLTAKQNQISNVFILGAGTNVLISDKGFGGLVILNRIQGIEKEGDNLKVGSGVTMKDLLDYCVENSLSGLEWAGGLPGTIGGAVRGNAGSFKGEIKDNVVQVESLDMKTLEEKVRGNNECGFNYRNSAFKSGDGSGEFITHVILRLIPGDKEEIKEKIKQKMEYRFNRNPVEFPSIGSTFKNIPLESLSHELQKEFAPIVKTDPFPVVPVAKLLALSGLKGRRVGGVEISEKQPNFFINVGNASSQDVEALIAIAKQAIKEKYGILIEEEIVRLL